MKWSLAQMDYAARSDATFDQIGIVGIYYADMLEHPFILWLKQIAGERKPPPALPAMSKNRSAALSGVARLRPRSG